MSHILHRTALLGFGEAGIAFAEQWGPQASAAVRAYDIKTDDPAAASAKRADFARLGVTGTGTLREAVAGADMVLSVVTADRALEAARAAAALLKPGALYCDFNSVAPQTKRAAATAVSDAGGRYADVAVMAPVRPQRLSVPLLVSGPDSGEACALLRQAGFAPRDIAGEVGRASMIKMLRSVMIKGIEAVTAECYLAAHAAGVVDEVTATLNASWPGVDWAERADYNLERMMVHGRRRAAEMEEVAATVAGLGLPKPMSRATGEAQRRIGQLGLKPVEGLAAKSAHILDSRDAAA